MRKALSLIFLLFFLSLFFVNKTHAVTSTACELTIDPSTIKGKFKGEIILQSADNCFFTGAKYSVAVHPAAKKMDFDPTDTRSSFQQDITTSDRKTLRSKININLDNNPQNFLIRPHKGSDNQDVWNVFVCLGELRYCDDNNFANLQTTGKITVSNNVVTPSPTPASDLPIIDYSNQLACSFQIQSGFSIEVTNVLPDADYNWWWEDDKRLRSVEKTLASTPTPTDSDISYNPILTVFIPPSETEKRGTRRFCADLASKGTGRGCFQNGIFLNFLIVPPDDQSCDISNSIEATPTPPPTLLPCSQWAYSNGQPIPTSTDIKDIKEKKCISVHTAIGNINTDPAKFVQFIFSIVLGLAGGIALVLIMISGYRFMASQGNPEAVQAARDQLTSAIVGLLFIIFSFVILQVIGVDILKIPGFNP